MTVVPTEAIRYDLVKAAELLLQAGYKVVDMGVMITAISPEREITMYPSGRMVVSNIKDKKEAGQVAEAIYCLVGPSIEASSKRS